MYIKLSEIEIRKGDKVELLSKLFATHDGSGYSTNLPKGYTGIVKEILNDGILLESHYIGETNTYKISKNDALTQLKVIIPSNIKDAPILN
jgi:hypothetical protein